MSCSNFQIWVVSDDLDDRRQAEEHAASCKECAQILSGHEALRGAVAVWVEQDEAPANLEEKVRSRIAEMVRAPVVPIPINTGRLESGSAWTRRRSTLWIALAASFLLGIGLGVFRLPATSQAPTQTRRLLDASALQIAEQEEAAHVKSIAGLEAQVDSILARARDKELASHQAARLMEYGSRIATLDVTIDDVRGFVEQNPGHPRARTMLLDAYKEKRNVLREVIALEEKS